MPLLDRFLTRNKELGKKDDDHRPRAGANLPSSWAPRQSMLAFRRRRFFYGLLIILFIYLFIRNIPSDMGPNSRRGDIRVPLRGPSSQSAASALPSGEPPHPDKPSDAEKFYFSGPIKFYKLAVSLHSVAALAGHNGANKNVLFAASSLRSASEILPLACEMATWKRNDVHFALMGRDDLEVDEIMRLNGVNSECEIHWHDARPDFAPWSSNFRMEVSVSAGMGHIQTFIHPQVIITDNESREDAFFTKAVRAKALGIGKSVIELPLAAAENLMWITRLDSGSLAAWHTVYVDLLIHAPPKSSGTLIRLLKSIENADYFGARRPHLTIELPAEIDQATADYLENLVWPPLDWSGAPHASQVTVRHRMPRHSPTAGEASSHFIESFYPARPKDSHVLLISPQAELSSIYYHYAMYHLLEYKYSAFGERTHEAKNLMGFTLELPSTYLNDSTPLEPPVLEPDHARRSSREAHEPTPFLWQAPNSNAALYFGEKWVELHSFLSARMYIQDPRLPTDQRPPPQNKVVSESYPSWMEYFQELMRVRGYFLLYPHFPDSDDAIVTIHEELRQPPQEFPKKRSLSIADPPKLDPNEPFVTDPSAFEPILPPSPEAPLVVKNLIALLPYSGDLPQITILPILSHEGNILSRKDAIAAAHQFTDEFRDEIGRCNGNGKSLVESMSAKDLFCNLGQSQRTDPVARKSKEGTADVRHDKNTEKEVDYAHDEEDGEGEEEEGEGEQEKEQPKLAFEKKSEKQIQNEFETHLQRQAGKADDTVAHTSNKKAAEKGLNKNADKKSSSSDTAEKKDDRLSKAETTTSNPTATNSVKEGAEKKSESVRQQQRQDLISQAPLTPLGGDSTKSEGDKQSERQQPSSAKQDGDNTKERKKEDLDKPMPKPMPSKDVIEKTQVEERKPGW